MGILALISLGSNLGDRRAHLDFAVDRLRQTPAIHVRAVSGYRETPPVGGPQGQGQFLNAAAALETELDPPALLPVLQDIENQAGRLRKVRWGERSLDLDLLYFGDQFISNDLLQIPHPRAAVRRFVLAPLAEIAPEFVDPLTGRTIAGLLANLDARPSYLAFADISWPVGRAVYRRLTAKDSGEGFDVVGSMLNRERWQVEARRERWLVSHFWLDSWYRRQPVTEARDPSYWERFLELRTLSWQPTFVVAPVGGILRFSRLGRDEVWQPPLGDVPVLEVDPDDPERAEREVRAACAATRAS
jgi:2-amino-4-hydroxy-6-hydroxymethyldihydropteridine diphosphokinase